MNSLKIAYIISMSVGQILMLAAAVLIPIYITPGYYWWTAFFIIMVMGDGVMIGKRMNLWTGEA